MQEVAYSFTGKYAGEIMRSSFTSIFDPRLRFGCTFADEYRYSAMGKSRSAAVVCAYLMHRYRVSVDEALAQVREGRAFCEPNDGFMKQLQIFYENGASDDFKDSAAYQKWLSHRELLLSNVSQQSEQHI